MITSEIVAFSNGNTNFYEKFEDYHNHKSDAEWGKKMGAYDVNVSLSEKKEKLTQAYFAEIERLSGCPRTKENADSWFANPMVRYANFAVINATVNVVLPAYVTATFAPFIDFRTVGYGDVVNFKIPPKTLYTVSRGTMGERTSFRQRKFAGNVTLAPIEHIITTYVDMVRVLAGKDDLAEAVRAIVISIELEFNKDILNALTAGFTAGQIPAAFVVSGTFDPKAMVQLAERVGAYNAMAKPIIVGTAAALMNVLPSATAGYRMTVDGKAGVVSYVSNFYGYDLYEIPQSASGDNFGLALSDDTLYVISPAADKAVKAVMSTALTNSNDFYDNADISQNFTMRKAWDAQFAAGAYVGQYTITG